LILYKIGAFTSDSSIKLIKITIQMCKTLCLIVRKFQVFYDTIT